MFGNVAVAQCESLQVNTDAVLRREKKAAAQAGQAAAATNVVEGIYMQHCSNCVGFAAQHTHNITLSFGV